MRRLVVCLLLLLWLPCAAHAHPGGTDSNGGHYNRKTGEYHYHHGYPEHQHTNGKCPYDFKDKTGQSSGTSYKKITPTAAPRSSEEKGVNGDGALGYMAAAGGAGALAYSIGKNRKK